MPTNTHEVGPRVLKLASLTCGAVLTLYAITQGVDGALLATGGMLIGYAIGKGT